MGTWREQIPEQDCYNKLDQVSLLQSRAEGCVNGMKDFQMTPSKESMPGQVHEQNVYLFQGQSKHASTAIHTMNKEYYQKASFAYFNVIIYARFFQN